MAISRLAISNPPKNTDTLIAVTDKDSVCSVIATNKGSSPATIDVWVVPSEEDENPENWLWLAKNIDLSPPQSIETFRFAAQLLDKIYVRTNSDNVSFHINSLSESTGNTSVFVQTTPPTAPIVGDIWVNTNTSVISFWNGAVWIQSNDSYLPTLSGNASKFLTNNGTTTLWSNLDLTSYASNSELNSHTEATTDVHGIADTSLLATTSYVDSQVASIIDSAPSNLNTLNELAAALNDDSNFSSTVVGLIAEKEPIILPGTTNQYLRGDKTWQVIDKAALGLGSVENTALSTWSGSSNITSVGTVISGTWNANTISASKGGTGISSYAIGDIIYASGSNTLAKLPGNTSTGKKFLTQTGQGISSAAPEWLTLSKSDIGLSNVENTALSTWIGSNNISTIGLITNGTWQASVISETYIDTAIARLASPTFTGTPQAPTANAGTNTTQIATTAFVRTEISNLIDAAPSSLDTLNELAAALADDANFATTMTNALALKAPLASPSLTGIPLAPTADAGTNTTQIATTAFVNSEIALDRPFEATTANIAMNGIQSTGSLNTVARGDHVHPTDTTRAPVESPTFTGTPAAPTATAGTNTTQIATTQFVTTAVADGILSVGADPEFYSTVMNTFDDIYDELALKSYLASPTFTGTVSTDILSASGLLTASAGIAAEPRSIDNITTRVASGFIKTDSATTTNGWPETNNSTFILINATDGNLLQYNSLQLAASMENGKLFFRSTNNSGSREWFQIATTDYVMNPFLLSGM